MRTTLGLHTITEPTSKVEYIDAGTFIPPQHFIHQRDTLSQHLILLNKLIRFIQQLIKVFTVYKVLKEWTGAAFRVMFVGHSNTSHPRECFVSGVLQLSGFLRGQGWSLKQ